MFIFLRTNIVVSLFILSNFNLALANIRLNHPADMP